MAINSSTPENSRALARIFNEKRIFDLGERRALIQKYDTVEALEKALGA